MTLNTGRIKYEVIREVYIGDVNDVFVCRNEADRHAAYKTVWIVKERNLAKSLIKGFSKGGGICEEYFAQRENMCFVFPYVQERPLFRFYIGNLKDNNCSRQRIWLDLVTQCMTRKLPEGILNLILEQGQVNIAADGSIDFGYFLDLTNYREDVQEKDNVVLCVQRILDLIYLDNVKGKDSAVMLLEKKLKRNKYTEFIQLYKDIRIIMQDNSDIGRIERAKRFVLARQDTIYRVLSIICVVLVVVVAINFLASIVLPDFSFWKVFTNPLKQIGTQSLLN
jgi:hypothetical protein